MFMICYCWRRWLTCGILSIVGGPCYKFRVVIGGISFKQTLKFQSNEHILNFKRKWNCENIDRWLMLPGRCVRLGHTTCILPRKDSSADWWYLWLPRYQRDALWKCKFRPIGKRRLEMMSFWILSLGEIYSVTSCGSSCIDRMIKGLNYSSKGKALGADIICLDLCPTDFEISKLWANSKFQEKMELKEFENLK